jgi:hypothetical protein
MKKKNWSKWYNINICTNQDCNKRLYHEDLYNGPLCKHCGIKGNVIPKHYEIVIRIRYINPWWKFWNKESIVDVKNPEYVPLLLKLGWNIEGGYFGYYNKNDFNNNKFEIIPLHITEKNNNPDLLRIDEKSFETKELCIKFWVKTYKKLN